MSKSTYRPEGSTHFENDGTVWKCVNGQWYWWCAGWGWSPYVGKADRHFLNKLTEIGG